jgi:hypothetical protein
MTPCLVSEEVEESPFQRFRVICLVCMDEVFARMIDTRSVIVDDIVTTLRHAWSDHVAKAHPGEKATSP